MDTASRSSGGALIVEPLTRPTTILDATIVTLADLETGNVKHVEKTIFPMSFTVTRDDAKMLGKETGSVQIKAVRTCFLI